MTKRRQNKGFTIVEVLVATGLLMAVAAVALHFITHFNRMGDRMNTMATMEESLRSSLNRIEREVIEAAVILPEHPDDSTITTDKNRMVLGIPIYTDAGFVMVDDDGNALMDTMVIEAVTDNSSELLRNRSNMRSDRLLFSIDPQTSSVREDIENQVIARDLMPKIASGTNEGNYDYPGSMTGPSQGTFSYFGCRERRDGDPDPSDLSQPNFCGDDEYELVLDPAQSDDLSQAYLVKVLLWAEKNNRSGVLTSRKEIEVRLRNWGEIPDDEE